MQPDWVFNGKGEGRRRKAYPMGSSGLLSSFYEHKRATTML